MTASDQPDTTTVLAGHKSYTVRRAGAGKPMHAENDEIAQEVPVALEFNGISHATLLLTPANLEDFAVGFAYTEGIIRTARDIYDLDIVERPQGLVIQVTIASACLNELKLRRRNLAGRTGCGLCGIESLDEVQRQLDPLPLPQPGHYSAQAISKAVEQLRSMQALHQTTGATHAAGWANSIGDIEYVREDVGRHNALDKLIGHRLRLLPQRPNSDQAGFAVISSRASFEMVQKAASAGISALVAVSAPTSYAIDMACQLNVMLAGFARGNLFTVYSHHEFLDSGSAS
ncbi:formate dehydrogenase accessory sulfurtransferase FdhD [Pollutimonas harenae]|uniref:Sulfur carrier protein FdhD n=1 Tax=Pollutimonas harenae TaxID=657015 RepID=A0A853H4L6_9BURK|nr:formate dehydrogenase accessory sulfurtransferase FdhD [Pollutimonas harenae]NYT86859.1 formate dehydrogenase accessory sulfurtransferase FdhD [Pollutimonas harenae]TEA69423.1 formate dehydrogenase accessory sulfurtransferase FdhD [Pollutimonas harenae]